MDRIKIRGRPGEAGKITVEYISKLGQFYAQFYEKIKGKVQDGYLIYIDTNNKGIQEVFEEALIKLKEVIANHKSK